MAILKHGALQPNNWIRLADDEPVPSSGSVVVTFTRWQDERETLRGRNQPIGLALKNDQSALALAEDIHHFALIEIEFPKFTDGRAFSQARLLREQLGFKGEIRATGTILRDQYLFMIRCGIDAVELPETAKVSGYLEALKEFTVWYQPAADDRMSIIALRHPRSARLGAGAVSFGSVAAQPA